MAPKYEVGERILARNANNNYFFDAKIVSIDREKKEFRIHYQGWHKRYDEFIKEHELPERTQEFTEDSHAKAKELYASAKEANTKRRKPRRTGEGGGDKSRDTTPQSQANDEESTIPSETSGKNTRTRPSKRKLDETDSGKSMRRGGECNLTLPLPLKEVLVEDYDLITRQLKIYSLPAKTTVAQIFNDYLAEMNIAKTDTDEVMVEYENGTRCRYSSRDVFQSSKGIVDYFEALLPMQLLYKYERPQYVAHIENKKSNLEPLNKKRRSTKDVAVEASKPKASEVYGLPHLLRLLTRFDSYLKQSKYDEHIKESIQDVVCDFIVWLNKNYTKYFNVAEDYEVAPPDYQREAYT